MRQILQSLRDGSTAVVDVPAASPGRGHVLVRSTASLISAGTERMLLDFGKANWLDKARQQPDKVRMVLDKIRTDGLAPTLESVRAKLDQPIALGYSNAGVVLDVGPGVAAFSPGDRVVSNGSHAEVVAVPVTLCAATPDTLADEDAAFTVVAAIALQGIRLAAPTLGETVVVTGLGLIGLLAVQLLRAQGCRVIGLDFDRRKLALAHGFGAETVDLSGGGDAVSAAMQLTHGRGVDAVLITAATKSNEPVHQAALMCRQRGRIVLVGVTGLELSRDDFYKKELSFQVSCSYGPGRYDTSYEQGGQDYPYGHVRWTAQRNFEAVLDLMASGRLDVRPLITHRFAFENALEAYALLDSPEFHLGIVLGYSRLQADADLRRRRLVLTPERRERQAAAQGRMTCIGAGGYATKVLIPALVAAGAVPTTVVSKGGLSAATAARRFGFAEAATDVSAALADARSDIAVIATQHDSHAALVCEAIRAGKHVFVEKPLALTPAQVDAIVETWTASARQPLLMVGFNRRFAPLVRRMRELLAPMRGAKTFIYTVNAGAIPADHWTQREESGGGRIAGEACHFLDLARHLAGCAATSVRTTWQSADTATLVATFEDGSTATVLYLATGHKAFPKERLEVFVEGRVLVLDNFRTLTGYGWPGFRHMRLWRQDKGAGAMAQAFMNAVRDGGDSPIPFDELIEVARLTIEAARRSS